MMASAVAGTRKPIFSGAPRAKPCLPLWETNDLGMQRAEIRGDIASVIENQSTTRHRACKLAKGNSVHGNQHARMRIKGDRRVPWRNTRDSEQYRNASPAHRKASLLAGLRACPIQPAIALTKRRIPWPPKPAIFTVHR